MILAARLQPLIELLHRRTLVRRDAFGIAFDRNQRVGLLRSGREDTPWSMIFERSADQVHAVRQQRRGQRVALAAGQMLAVETECQGLRAVDAAADSRAERFAHWGGASPGL